MNPLPPELPESLREIAVLCGLDAALQLAAVYGGTEIFIPVRPDGPSAAVLRALLGEHAAAALIRAYPGHRLAIPRCVRLRRDHRDQAIIDAYTHGAPVRALARQHGLTTRQVRTILKRVPDAGSVEMGWQLQLF